MIPALLGMGGWLAKVAAVSVIPKVVQALQSALAAPAPSEVSSPKPDSHVKYTFDQLGSVRELVDSSGVVRADYRYSTYGERTKEAGDLESDWGYAGLFHHGPSGLDLATYRTYDSKMGRWLSRDPLGEGVDYNLYRYCGNNPISCVDPSGLIVKVKGRNRAEQCKLDAIVDWNYAHSPRFRRNYDLLNSAPQIFNIINADLTFYTETRYVHHHGLTEIFPENFSKGGPNGDYSLNNGEYYIDLDLTSNAAWGLNNTDVLAHEFEHATQALERPNDFIWGNYLNSQNATRDRFYNGNRVHAAETHIIGQENIFRNQVGHGPRP